MAVPSNSFFWPHLDFEVVLSATFTASLIHRCTALCIMSITVLLLKQYHMDYMWPWPCNRVVCECSLQLLAWVVNGVVRMRNGHAQILFCLVAVMWGHSRSMEHPYIFNQSFGAFWPTFESFSPIQTHRRACAVIPGSEEAPFFVYWINK